MIVFHEYGASTASTRVRIALIYKGLDYKSVIWDLNKSENHSKNYEGLNPQRLLPALEYDGEIFNQSLPIIEYLDKKHPTPPLLPDDEVRKAWVRSVSQIIASDTHALLSRRAGDLLKGALNLSTEHYKIWQLVWLKNSFEAVEARLRTHRYAGKFCDGDAPSLADITLIPHIVFAKKLGFLVEEYERTYRTFLNCLDVPAFAKAVETQSA